MGFFSWNCKECDHPMLSEYAVSSINKWMNDVVVIEHSGGVLKGSYDGYGRVDGRDIRYGPWVDHVCTNEPCCYHRSCWEVAGKPDEYSPSESSSDQGYFFGPDAHAMRDPQRQVCR
jgi:hypothetical protein